MENGFEWPGLLSALLAQQADEYRPERPILLAVDRELDRRLAVRRGLLDRVSPNCVLYRWPNVVRSFALREIQQRA
jgi:hypothetical protein